MCIVIRSVWSIIDGTSLKKKDNVLLPKLFQKKNLNAYLDEYDLIVPKPVNYHVSTFDIYSRDHNISDLLLSRQYIENNCPEYLSAFDNE